MHRAKLYLVQNVNTAIIEKPWSKWLVTLFLSDFGNQTGGYSFLLAPGPVGLIRIMGERLSLSFFRPKYGDILLCYFLQIPWVPWTIKQRIKPTQRNMKKITCCPERSRVLIIANFGGEGVNVKSYISSLFKLVYVKFSVT